MERGFIAIGQNRLCNSSGSFSDIRRNPSRLMVCRRSQRPALMRELATKGVDAINKEMTSEVEGDEEILTFDIADETLERAASAEQNAFTVVYCTHNWHNCGWPQ
jgi:hypothetical protein